MSRISMSRINQTAANKTMCEYFISDVMKVLELLEFYSNKSAVLKILYDCIISIKTFLKNKFTTAFPVCVRELSDSYQSSRGFHTRTVKRRCDDSTTSAEMNCHRRGNVR